MSAANASWQLWCGDPSRRTFTSIVSNTPQVPPRSGSIRILTCHFNLCHRRLEVGPAGNREPSGDYQGVCVGLQWAGPGLHADEVHAASMKQSE